MERFSTPRAYRGGVDITDLIEWQAAPVTGLPGGVSLRNRTVEARLKAGLELRLESWECDGDGRQQHLAQHGEMNGSLLLTGTADLQAPDFKSWGHWSISVEGPVAA